MKTQDLVKRLLINRYMTECDGVSGWIFRSTRNIFAHLAYAQQSFGLKNSVMEIGVHHGKSFIPLAISTIGQSKAIAVDLFSRQDENVDRSGMGDIDIFKSNLERFCPPANVIIMEENSSNLDAKFIKKHGPLRFVSVDGGHTAESTENDMWVAEKMLVEGGLVALDDIFRIEWGGVTTGLFNYYMNGGSLIPVFASPNKLFFSNSAEAGKQYNDYISTKMPEMVNNNWPQQKMFSRDPIPVYIDVNRDYLFPLSDANN